MINWLISKCIRFLYYFTWYCFTNKTALNQLILYIKGWGHSDSSTFRISLLLEEIRTVQSCSKCSNSLYNTFVKIDCFSRRIASCILRRKSAKEQRLFLCLWPILLGFIVHTTGTRCTTTILYNWSGPLTARFLCLYNVKYIYMYTFTPYMIY